MSSQVVRRTPGWVEPPTDTYTPLENPWQQPLLKGASQIVDGAKRARRSGGICELLLYGSKLGEDDSSLVLLGRGSFLGEIVESLELTYESPELLGLMPTGGRTGGQERISESEAVADYWDRFFPEIWRVSRRLETESWDTETNNIEAARLSSDLNVSYLLGFSSAPHIVRMLGTHRRSVNAGMIDFSELWPLVEAGIDFDLASIPAGYRHRTNPAPAGSTVAEAFLSEARDVAEAGLFDSFKAQFRAGLPNSRSLAESAIRKLKLLGELGEHLRFSGSSEITGRAKELKDVLHLEHRFVPDLTQDATDVSELNDALASVAALRSRIVDLTDTEAVLRAKDSMCSLSRDVA